MKNKRILSLFLAVLLVVSVLGWAVDLKVVQAQGVSFCCEKTDYGAWCQNAPEEQCDSAYRKTPTSCEATSYCKLGCCYDSAEGICMENTPQKVCDQAEGHWEDSSECDIPQCNLGCCVLGTQAAFVTLTRCKKLSSFYGLLTDFRGNIDSEMQCISLASLGDEGACVYELDYIKTCKFTSRQECDSIKQGIQSGNETGTMTGSVEFHKDYLCSAEELGTNCGLTKDTICVDGKDEVYFVDSCGNPANIYDASKVKDKEYWRKKISKEDSCGSGSANVNSRSCGNCNYFEGSICRKAKGGTRASYGDNICMDLNCRDTSSGEPKKHGESWCSTDDKKDSVGSRYVRHLCMNGEEIIEPCSDFRQETCIEDNIDGFSQAACRVNRWQECYSQTEKTDCENSDKRDCKWIYDKDEVEYKTTEEGEKKTEALACVPLNSPGLKFWEEGESQGICSQANTQCVVTFEKSGFFTGGGEKCVDNCECLEDSWKLEQLKKCEAIGDCGAKINFAGVKGNKKGYKIKIEKVEEKEGGGGGLFGLHLVLNKLGLSGRVVDDTDNEVEKR